MRSRTFRIQYPPSTETGAETSPGRRSAMAADSAGFKSAGSTRPRSPPAALLALIDTSLAIASKSSPFLSRATTAFAAAADPSPLTTISMR